MIKGKREERKKEKREKEKRKDFNPRGTNLVPVKEEREISSRTLYFPNVTFVACSFNSFYLVGGISGFVICFLRGDNATKNIPENTRSSSWPLSCLVSVRDACVRAYAGKCVRGRKNTAVVCFSSSIIRGTRPDKRSQLCHNFPDAFNLIDPKKRFFSKKIRLHFFAVFYRQGRRRDAVLRDPPALRHAQQERQVEDGTHPPVPAKVRPAHGGPEGNFRDSRKHTWKNKINNGWKHGKREIIEKFSKMKCLPWHDFPLIYIFTWGEADRS